jgi:hypothetical protein
MAQRTKRLTRILQVLACFLSLVAGLLSRRLAGKRGAGNEAASPTTGQGG